MHSAEQDQGKQPSAGQPASTTPRFGVVLAVLASLAAAWIAAGSTGLLADPLRRALTFLALGTALLAPGVGTLRPGARALLTVVVGSGAACLVVLATAPANVMAAVLVLAFLGVVSKGTSRQVLLEVAAALAVFGLYCTARTSIPWVWLLADRLGRGVGVLGGAVASGPLRVGATFAGLDFLIVMGVLWALCLRRTRGPRTGPALYGFLAILGGHLAYLVVLAYVPDLLRAVVPSGDEAGWWSAELPGQALPWNAPVIACGIHLLVAGALLRWSAWAGPDGGQSVARPVRSVLTRMALLGAALSMAILVPIVTVLYTGPVDAAGKKIVFYEKGFLNWLKPTHESYGRLSSGMYGMLPAFVERLGAESLISAELSEDDLRDADALVLLYPDTPWTDGQLGRIDAFVRRGGSLLVMGEHTTGDPNGASRFNEVLAATAMRVRFDSGTFAVGGWLHSYETTGHPATVGQACDRNAFGVVIGASVEARWPARPLLIGRWGWADPGDVASERAMMGNGRYDGGELLGDVVLAAEQPLGEGKVIVFGDTSSFQNAINVTSHVFTSRLLTYLAGDAPEAHPWWRQLLGVLACVLLAGLVCWRPGPWKTAVVALGLAASLAICQQATVAAVGALPDGRAESPNDLAYIDASHVEAYSRESWRPDGVGGLALTLMRNGYLTLSLPELTGERLERAGVLISIAPSRAFSQSEVETIEAFVEGGGTFVMTVGHDEGRAGAALLSRFGFGIGDDERREPAPLGHFKSPYLESENRRAYVRFHAAWPVRCTDPNARVITYGRDNQPVIMLRRVGAGKVVVIGDTCFAMNKNLEQESGQPFEGLRENADFWRWLIALLRDEPMWIPPALQGASDGAETDPGAETTTGEVTP